jgi:hypothetical protein
MSARYLVEGLHTITYLLNRLPCKAISFFCPYVAFYGYGVAPSYEHLHVFGCVCYHNLSAQTVHKLALRSTRCVFLEYSADHKGYRYLDLVRLSGLHHTTTSTSCAPRVTTVGAPRVPAAADDQIVLLGDPTKSKTEADSQTVSLGG